MVYDLFPLDYQVWDNRPGGKVVNSYTKNGVEYVAVEFEHSPGIRYMFLAK